MRQFYLSLLIFTLFGTSVFAQESVQTRISNGFIEGFTDKGIDHYFGIPFAQPPIGELRWKAPQPPKDWEGVKQTKEFGPAPVQANVFDDMVFRSPGQSETAFTSMCGRPLIKRRKKCLCCFISMAADS